MTYMLNGLLGSGTSWPDSFDAVGLPFRRFEVAARDGQPLFLVRPASLSRFGVMSTLDELSRDRPELPAPFLDLVDQATESEPLAIVGVEFWAGRGFQWSAAWGGGRKLFGPFITATDDTEVEDERFVVTTDLAIDRLLLWIGVDAVPGHDEFSTIGLGSTRRNQDDPPVT